MSELRDLATQLGFSDARTLLQSGNLIFRGAAEPAAGIEQRLAAETGKRLGVHTDFFVRTAAEWRQIIARNPFPDEAERDPGYLLVMVLRDAPQASGVKTLQAATTGPEIVRPGSRHLYLFYPAGVGRSKLTNVLVEKKLATRGTARNWNTVLKLAAAAGAP